MVNIKVGDQVRSKITGVEGKVTSIKGGYIEITHWYAVITTRQNFFNEEYEKI